MDAADPAAALAAALCVEEIYRGDLHIPSDSLTDVLLDVQRELREMFVDAMIAGCEAAMMLGRMRTAVRLVSQATIGYELREDVAACHIRALRRSGRRAEAERQYRRYVRLLDEQLNVAPSLALRLALFADDKGNDHGSSGNAHLMSDAHDVPKKPIDD